jgi:autotransporter-associated beta strand protein
MTAGTIGAAAANNTIAFNFTGGTLQNVTEVNGGGLVTKSGSGVGVLAGTNTYTGGTSVTGGSLLVNGSVTGAVTVSSGTNLGGSGSIAGAVTLDGNLRTGGVVATADTYGVGVLTVGSLTFGATSTDNRFEANANGFNASALNGDGSINTVYISNTANRTTGTTDRLQITNQLDIGTNDGVNFSFALSGYTAQIGDAFDLLDWVTLAGGGFGNFNYGTEGVLRSGGITEDALYDLDLPELQAGYFWNIDAFNETGVIVVVGTVPEPSRVFLMLGAGMMMILRRRRARVA